VEEGEKGVLSYLPNFLAPPKYFRDQSWRSRTNTLKAVSLPCRRKDHIAKKGKRGHLLCYCLGSSASAKREKSTTKTTGEGIRFGGPSEKRKAGKEEQRWFSPNINGENCRQRHKGTSGTRHHEPLCPLQSEGGAWHAYTKVTRDLGEERNERGGADTLDKHRSCVGGQAETERGVTPTFPIPKREDRGEREEREDSSG